MQAVIMAGGKGTRLSDVTKNELPKPMVRLEGKPVLEYQLEGLYRNGIRKFIFVVGCLGEKIEEYFGNGEKWDVQITYIREEQPLGTAGSLYYLKDRLSEDFLLVLGDLVFDISIGRFYQFFKDRRAGAALLVHPNAHPYDSDLILLDEKGRVTAVDPKNKRRAYDYNNLVNAGIYLLSQGVLDKIDKPEKLDLEKDILFPMILGNEGVYGYRTPEYVRDIGTPERLCLGETDIKRRIVSAKNLEKKQKCIFLGWDSLADAKPALKKEAEKAVARINRSEYLTVLAADAPVEEGGKTRRQLHKKLETLLGERGCYVDGIGSGLGEALKYQEEYNIDLETSWLVGTTETELQKGKEAGIRTVFVKEGIAKGEKAWGGKADLVCETLMEAVASIIG